MKRTFILFCLIAGIGLVGCSDSSEKNTSEAPVAKTPVSQAAEQNSPAPEAKAVPDEETASEPEKVPEPEPVAEPENDHHKISFDGYRIGDKFEDKGYKGHPFVHENPRHHYVEWDMVNKLSILTLEDGRIALISKTYFVNRLQDFVDKFSIKSELPFKPVSPIMGTANIYRGKGKDVVVEISTTDQSRFVSDINDMTGKISVDVASPALMKKLDEEIAALKQARRKKAAENFEF